MLETCSRCVTHYDPNADPDASATFCGDCARKLATLSREAETYQQQIKSGDANVKPLNKADALKNRQAIRRRYGHNPGNADTRMVTHRDKK